MGRSVVAVSKGEDKLSLLSDVLRESGFFDVLETRLAELRKPREGFVIAVKPNLMMFTHREIPPGTYTDPELVEALIRMLQGLFRL